MEVKQKDLELLQDINDFATEILKSTAGLSETDARKAAKKLSDAMRQAWGGNLIYFPKGTALDVTERDMQMWNDFNGTNHDVLVKRYGLCLQNVYKRLALVRNKVANEQQQDMFED